MQTERGIMRLTGRRAGRREMRGRIKRRGRGRTTEGRDKREGGGEIFWSSECFTRDESRRVWEDRQKGQDLAWRIRKISFPCFHHGI